jgi:hypothetical protein
LAALFILSLLRQSGALCSLPSEGYSIHHDRASDVLQHFLFCNATKTIAASTMGFLRSPLPQVHLAEDDQLVQALAAQGADQTFRVTILPI